MNAPVRVAPVASAPVPEAAPQVPIAAEAQAVTSQPQVVRRTNPYLSAETLASPPSRPASVRVNLDASGHVKSTSLELKSGNPSFDNEALRAVSNWEFRPAIRGGQAVESVIVVRVEYPRQ